MRRYAVLLPLAVCSLALHLQANGQQFRSARKVIRTDPSLAQGINSFGEVEAIADYNGDGRLDFVTSKTGSEGYSVMALMLQNADGTFSAMESPSLPLGLAISADLNGDGHADIVSPVGGTAAGDGYTSSPATLTISYGDGHANFFSQQTFNLAGDDRQPTAVVIDLNKDKKPDIVALSTDDSGNSYLESFMNDGNGNFTAGPTYGGAIYGGRILAAADFNGDGFGDVVIRNNSKTQILLGDGKGNFSAGHTYSYNPLYVGIGDLNRDHHQDMVIVTPINSRVMLGNGTGAFTLGATLDTSFGTATSNVEFTNPVNPNCIYIGDLNHDGFLDVVVATQSSTSAAAVYFGKGNGTFTNPRVFNIGGVSADYPAPSGFADFTGDGQIDAMALTRTAGFTVAKGTPDGGFNAPLISLAPNAVSIVKGDFNGDGIDDIATVDGPDCPTCTGTSIRVFLGSGNGYFLAPATYRIPLNFGAIATGDINNDGKLDLVVTRNAKLINSGKGTYSAPDLTVLIGRGDGTFEAPSSYALLGAPTPGAYSPSVFLVDVNHDGKLDLIGDWGTALGKGNGRFNAPIPLPPSFQGLMDLAPGNFDNSGNVGLAVADTTFDGFGYSPPAYVYILTGDGHGNFHIANRQSTGTISSLAVADLNNDGLSDILYTYIDSTSTGVFSFLGISINRGGGTYSTANYSLPLSSGLSDGIITGDFNRDGNLDVAVLDEYANHGDAAVLFGTGDGTLNPVAQYYQGSMSRGVVVNVNADSAPDIVGTTTIGASRLLNTGAK